MAPPVADPAIAPTPAATLADPGLELSAKSAPAPAHAPAVDVAAPAPVLPSSVPAAPSPAPHSPLAEATANLYVDPHQLAGRQAELKSRRIRNACGSVLRTSIVAALLGGAVFGGRYGYDWYADSKEAASPTSVLPTEPVAPLDARYISYSVQTAAGPDAAAGSVLPSPSAPKVTVSFDLATGDMLATTDDGAAPIKLARRGGAYWAADGSGLWAPAAEPSYADPATRVVGDAALLTITDVLPVEVHPYASVVGDETAMLPGTPFVGPEVIDVGGVDVTAPTGSQVPVRHLTVTIDRDAFVLANPAQAIKLGFSKAGSVEIEVWVDATGTVRRSVAPGGVGTVGGTYELLSASGSGPGPLAGVDLGNGGAAPAVEGAP